MIKVKTTEQRKQYARTVRREMNKLQAQRDKLYAQAIKRLKVVDDGYTFDYFYNMPSEGFSTFEETL